MTSIPTDWNGWRFRSRLEARWAIFFTEMGIKFDYEPIGFKLDDGCKYLVDFWLPQIKMFAEVKCGFPTERESAKAQLLHKGSGANVIFLDGAPDFRRYYAVVMDCGLYNLVPLLLDIHNYRKHFAEGRLFSDADQDQEFDFSSEYKAAIHASRAERFDGK